MAKSFNRSCKLRVERWVFAKSRFVNNMAQLIIKLMVEVIEELADGKPAIVVIENLRDFKMLPHKPSLFGVRS